MTKEEIPKWEKRTKVLTLRITQSEFDALDRFCEKNHVKKSHLIRLALSKIHQIELQP